MTILFVNSDALQIPLADKSINCVVTSPPYFGLRDYGVGGQIGLEETPEAYVEKMVAVFREVWRVLRDDGTLWLNLGDSYSTGADNKHAGGNIGAGRSKDVRAIGSTSAGWTKHRKVPQGLKPKDLIGIPWMVAFALRADGWYLRSDIIWHKPNPMPESVTDRPTKAHEYLFLLTKSARYYYDAAAIREPIKDSSAARLSQDVENQEGSLRATGGAKTNGKMKTVKFGGNKAAGYGVRTKSGKEWMPTQGGGDTGFKGHSGNTLTDGTVLTTANKKSVWTVATQPYSGAHFATFPPDLIEPCIRAGCTEGGIVLDPFSGTGTTAMVARKLKRHAIGLDISLTYIRECARDRLSLTALDEWENGRKVDSTHDDLPLFQKAQP